MEITTKIGIVVGLIGITLVVLGMIFG